MNTDGELDWDLCTTKDEALKAAIERTKATGEEWGVAEIHMTYKMGVVCEVIKST
jgi:hypothetical protein